MIVFPRVGTLRGLACLLLFATLLEAWLAASLTPPLAAGTLPTDDPNLDFRSVINRAKEKVFPAVVFVKCIRETYEEGKKSSREVSGSGVIISEAGEFLTNWHVVEKAVQIRCLLLDGSTASAKIVGTDKDTDVALLRLELPPGAAKPCTAKLGDSASLREGDFVMAMGAPWGLSRSVSMGIVSCTRRFLPSESEYSLWLQTDASICPGNSGGPLVNTLGEVIGINARAMTQGGDMGFAIPSETIQAILERLRALGKVDWSWTGLLLQPLKDFERNTYFDATDGVLVADTEPDSPARRAGVLSRDRILAIGDSPVTAATEEELPAVRRRLALLEKGKPVKLKIHRGTATLDVDLTPREKGKVEGEELECVRWDLTVKTINQFENSDLYFHRKSGVFIFGIKYPGNASNSGLQTQDIILKIGGAEVTTIEDVKRIHKETLDGIATKHRAVFTVLRNGLLRQVVLDFSRDHSKE